LEYAIDSNSGEVIEHREIDFRYWYEPVFGRGADCEEAMRDLRDFVPGQIYGVIQRGNKGQWVFKDEEDFLKALSLMDRDSDIHEVKVHGYCLMPNHGALDV